MAEEFRIGARAHRAALIGRGAFMNGDRLSPPLRVDRGARQAPKGAHPLQAVGSARGGEAGLTHRLHLLPAKGRPGLQAVDLLPQDLALHREFAHLGLEPGVLLGPLIRRAGFERRLAPAKERLAPGGKPSRCRAQLAAERLQALAPQKTQDRLPLALAGEPTPLTAMPWGLGSVRPTGTLRQSPLLLLFVHRDTPFSMNHGSIECPTKP